MGARWKNVSVSACGGVEVFFKRTEITENRGISRGLLGEKRIHRVR